MSKENCYPKILLSDGQVDSIEITQNDLIINFDKYGLFVKKQEQYFREQDYQIVFKNVDYENIQLFTKKHLSILNLIQIDYCNDMDILTLQKNVNQSLLRITFVNEFYSEMGGLFILRCKTARKSFWCYLNIQYERITYCKI